MTRYLDLESPECAHCGELIRQHEERVEYGDDPICLECADPCTCLYCGELVLPGNKTTAAHDGCVADYIADKRHDLMKDEAEE